MMTGISRMEMDAIQHAILKLAGTVQEEVTLQEIIVTRSVEISYGLVNMNVMMGILSMGMDATRLAILRLDGVVCSLILHIAIKHSGLQ